ncbi:putative multidrug resistance protein [Ixodes scapularis]
MDMVVILHEGFVREVHTAPFGQHFDQVAALDVLPQPSPPFQVEAAVARNHIRSIYDELSFEMTAGEMSSLSMTMAKRHSRPQPSVGLPKPGQLIEDEAFRIGKMDPRVYRDYIQRFGPIMVVLMLILYFGCRAFDMLSSLWISSWSEDPASGSDFSNTAQRNWRLAVYAFFGVCQGLAIWAGSLILGFRALQASKSLHESILYRVVRAPMWFFDTTPLGRILNRFTKDLDQADYYLPMVMDAMLEHLTDVIGVGVLITIYVPLFMLAILPCVLIYFIIQKTYVRTSRQLQRLESVSRSPLYNCVSETVPGVQTIRAYGVQTPFEGLSDALLERWVASSFYLMCADRWLTLRLNLLGTAITLVTAILLVHGRETTGAAAAGLTLLYALKVTDALNSLVRFTAELENALISIERLHEYTSVPIEAPWRVTPAPSPDWPSHGAVRFAGFSTRYRPELNLVLRNVNLNIDPSEKVALVGRTGSGKSSLTLSLFRILEAATGNIFIDDVDISALGLHDLRTKLTIIPQDPVLFAGSLRMNLDPNEEYSDEQVWAALEKAHLKRFFQNKPGNISFLVEEEGQNLSVGQHQLICLARALLRNTKVLVLDEATASVDPDTDGLVQRTIRRDFGHCTVITVAHRLQTIMDVDRIVMMRDGEIVEVGSPEKLLRDRESAFHAMAREAGLTRTESDAASGTTVVLDA